MNTELYKNKSKEELILLCEHLEQELIKAEAVNKAYKKHLEQVIEYNSVEKYKAVAQKNRALGVESLSYKEKLLEMLCDKEAEPIEWRQCNKKLDNGYTETEVTFKSKSSTPVKE